MVYMKNDHKNKNELFFTPEIDNYLYFVLLQIHSTVQNIIN